MFGERVMGEGGNVVEEVVYGVVGLVGGRMGGGGVGGEME